MRAVVNTHAVDDLVDQMTWQRYVLLRFLTTLLFHSVASRVRPRRVTSYLYIT